MKSLKNEKTNLSDEISREFAKILEEYNDPRYAQQRQRKKKEEEIKEDKLSTYGIF